MFLQDDYNAIPILLFNYYMNLSDLYSNQQENQHDFGYLWLISLALQLLSPRKDTFKNIILKMISQKKIIYETNLKAFTNFTFKFFQMSRNLENCKCN